MNRTKNILMGTLALLFFLSQPVLIGCGKAKKSTPQPTTSSPTDTDNDGIPDEQDSDDDNDGVADVNDFAPTDPSVSAPPAPADNDSDGVANGSDNCVDVANADQLDTDSDGAGNACDADDDNDGVADSSDAFPLLASETVDTDSDGTGNNADLDDDNDGTPDLSDCLPLSAAGAVNVIDAAGTTVCVVDDSDDDNDIFADASDCAPRDARSGINITNAMGTTECVVDDTDDDNDLVLDTSDNCPLVANADQADSPDLDGLGNVCDPDDNDNSIADADDPDSTRMTVWVSSTEGTDIDPDPATPPALGDINLPYATLGSAITAAIAATPNRNVYLVEGAYDVGAPLTLEEGVSLYGGWEILPPGGTTRLRDLTTRPLETIINNLQTSGAAAITFATDGTVTSGTVVNRLRFIGADGTSSASLTIVNASPTISNNEIGTGAVSGSATALSIGATDPTGGAGTATPIIENNEIIAGSTTAAPSMGSSVAISISVSTGGTDSPVIRNNTRIEGGDNPSGGESDAITISSSGTGSLASPSITGNSIIVSGDSLGAGGSSRAISGLATSGGTLSVTIEDNPSILSGPAGGSSFAISLSGSPLIPPDPGNPAGTPAGIASATIRRNTIEADSTPTISTPESVAVSLGETRVDPMSGMLETFAVQSATVEQNTMLGGDGSSAIGVRIVGATALTKVTNNIILGGSGVPAGGTSIGADLLSVSSQAWLVNNTIDSGDGPMTPTAISLDEVELGAAASNPYLINNILYSSATVPSTGIDEVCADCDPSSLENNLFTDSLVIYYSDFDAAGDIVNDPSTAADIAAVNAMPDISPNTANIEGAPSFVGLTPGGAPYLRLSASSAAIDAGRDTSAIDVPPPDGVVDIAVTADIDGDRRPLGSAYDIGADEFVP